MTGPSYTKTATCKNSNVTSSTPIGTHLLGTCPRSLSGATAVPDLVTDKGSRMEVRLDSRGQVYDPLTSFRNACVMLTPMQTSKTCCTCRFRRPIDQWLTMIIRLSQLHGQTESVSNRVGKRRCSCESSAEVSVLSPACEAHWYQPPKRIPEDYAYLSHRFTQ